MLAIPSPSGFEHGMATLIRTKLDALGYQHETDDIGNVLVRLEGQNKDASLCCYASHMDEIGFEITSIEADGTLRAKRSGGLLPWKFGEGPVEILASKTKGANSIQGILSMGSTHTAAAKGNQGQVITWDNVRILTGLSIEQLADAGIEVGSAGVPITEGRGPYIFGNEIDPLVAAWTFDDRLGCVTLLRLLEQLKKDNVKLNAPTLIAFTVQEEIGGFGAKHLCKHESPDIFVAVDGSPIPPETDLTLDGRPAAWRKDRLAEYDETLLLEFQKAATQAGTELQIASYDSAASDASMVASDGAKARIACFGHVRENSHGFEVARFSVFDNILNTLLAFMTSK